MKKYTLKNDSYAAQLSNGFLKPLIMGLDHLLHPRIKKERNSVQFVYGHHLFYDEIENFKVVTAYLAKNFKIISYSQAVDLLKNGEIDDNYLCFSFDDGMKNCMRIAEHFSSLEISAMFFINPEVVDNFDNEAYIQNHCSEKLHLKELDFMGWQDITLLLKMGHEVGNHTLSHKRLSAIPAEAYPDEIIRSKERIEKHAGPVKHFAWTYGLKTDITPEAFKMIVQSGHESVASAIRGQHFDLLNLKREYILRDQIIYKNPFYYFNYFFNKGNQPEKR